MLLDAFSFTFSPHAHCIISFVCSELHDKLLWYDNRCLGSCWFSLCSWVFVICFVGISMVLILKKEIKDFYNSWTDGFINMLLPFANGACVRKYYIITTSWNYLNVRLGACVCYSFLYTTVHVFT